MSKPSANTLYYGDNLEVLRRYIKDESVDLVYLDPPFNSTRDYNVLFKERGGERAEAQVKAFKDTWEWDIDSERTYREVVESGGNVAITMMAFRKLLGEHDMLAYLTMMAPRLVELHRVLKRTGSLYLHCDPTASSYLRLLLDAVFGPQNFRTEIIWKRTSAKGLAFTRLANNHDIILSYTKSEKFRWSHMHRPHDPEYVATFYRHKDADGRRYRLDNLANPNKNRPNLTYEFLGVTRVWRWTRERMEAEFRAGRVIQSKPGGVPAYKRYLDEQEGVPLDSLWLDIPPIGAAAAERLGYPTQKPEALLERILSMSSNPKDVVLDPFCGCGTTVAVAHRLKRCWIGIDITHLAVTLIKQRLGDAFKGRARFNIVGEPVSVADAQALAKLDPYQFQWWALGLVGARPVDEKKGADKGIDGRIFFHDEVDEGKTKEIVISVKSGHLAATHVRDLRGVVEREGAQMGVLISLEEPTKQMRTEAAAAGFYQSPWGKHPRLQVLTIEELLAGKQVDYPPAGQTNVTFKKAPKAKGAPHLAPEFTFEDEAEDDD